VYPTISEALPVTERLANRFLIFPSGHHVTVSDIEKIINLLETIWHHGNYIAKKMKELGK
jgi:dTDP-4-amino-4,6-dideoxygalactose transaminase